VITRAIDTLTLGLTIVVGQGCVVEIPCLVPSFTSIYKYGRIEREDVVAFRGFVLGLQTDGPPSAHDVPN
jgi:hypothetical protein